MDKLQLVCVVSTYSQNTRSPVRNRSPMSHVQPRSANNDIDLNVSL